MELHRSRQERFRRKSERPRRKTVDARRGKERAAAVGNRARGRLELLETKLAPLLDTMPHVKPVAAAEGLQTELGELLHADAIVLLDRLAQQSRQALALGEHLLELLL